MGRLIIVMFISFLAVRTSSAQDFDSGYLLGPDQRLDGSTPEARYRLLDPSQRLFPRTARSRYWLLDDSNIRFLEEHPKLVQQYGQNVFDRIKTLKQIDTFSKGEVGFALLLARLYQPGIVTTSLSMLQYLKLGADEYFKLSEEARLREFCRYRIAIYRQNGIMYPQECMK